MNTPAFLNEQVALFQGFTAERLQQSVDGSRVVSFEAREAIVHRGEAATRQILAQLKAGDSFNEMSLMTRDAMLADIIAESRCEVLLIPISLFQSVIVAEPGAVQRLSRTITERMRAVLLDPAKAGAALREGDDPYGLELKGERPLAALQGVAAPRDNH